MNISDKNLENNLDLRDFTNLEILECIENKLTELDISKCSKLKLINCGSNKLDKLDCSQTGENLILLICHFNRITELNITGCSNLRFLYCSSNFIDKIDLSQSLQLNLLDIADNNFPWQDLSFLDHLEKIEQIVLGNSDKRIKENKKNDKYNHFYGSLEPLRKMNKLKMYSIGNLKNVADDEYLSTNATRIDMILNTRARIDNSSNIVRTIFNNEGEKGLNNLS